MLDVYKKELILKDTHYNNYIYDVHRVRKQKTTEKIRKYQKSNSMKNKIIKNKLKKKK